VDRDFHRFLSEAQPFALESAGIIDDLQSLNIDMAISLGGDGTFLKAARCIGATGIPIVGINTGRLGFLADVSADEMEHFFAQLHQGHYAIRERSLLEIVAGDDTLHPSYALNEVTVSKHDSSSMIAVHTTVGGEHLATYMGDGLIIATPTGSTAYSLSAGGPVVAPSCRCLVLTPLTPHNLTMRPVVIPDTAKITLRVNTRGNTASVSADNHTHEIADGAVVSVRTATKCLLLAVPHNISYFDTLRNKMMWGIDIR
jgi:NAD+ kinase